MEGRKVKLAVSHEGKTENSQYLPESTKTGDFNPWRTLFGSFFVIPERLASICAVVYHEQTNTLNTVQVAIYTTNLNN